MGVYTIDNIRYVCRLCAKNHEQMKPIYINQYTQYNLKLLIQKFLPFIILNENDILSNYICVDCTSTLIVFNHFWETTKVTNEEFNLLISNYENKCEVNKVNERKLNNYGDHLYFSKIEDNIDFTPIKQFVQHLTLDIKDRDSFKSTKINDYEEKCQINKPDTLNVAKVVSHYESSRAVSGDRGRGDRAAATANFPILLNALTHQQPPSPPDRIDDGSVTSDHTYALPPLARRRRADGPERSYDGPPPSRRAAAPEELPSDHTYATRAQPETTEAAPNDDPPRRLDDPPLRDDKPPRRDGRHEPPTTRCDAPAPPRTDEHRCRGPEEDRCRADGGARCEPHASAAGGLDRRDPGCDPPVGGGGVKNHACAQCGKRFAARSTLRTHRRTHTNERPYACDECGKRFRRSTTAKKHVLFVHRKQRDHWCPVCGKPYFTATQVRMHMKRHTGVRDHVCGACGKAFFTKKTLTEHGKMVHGGPGGFVCSACGKAYKTKRYMVVHRKMTRCGDGARDEKDAPPVQPLL